jgi:hypothetical protein
MKKVKTIILSAFVLGILSVNLSIISNKTNGSLSLSSLVKEAFAQTEIPEVTITCSSGGSGQCYKDSGSWAYWCVNYWMLVHGCEFSGYQSDHCTPVACTE